MKFEFEKSPSKKGDCPNCKQKQTFRYYQGLPREYGKCERINECGYMKDPHKEPFEVQQELAEEKAQNPTPKTLTIQIYIKDELANEILNNQTSNFHNFILQTITADHLQKWKVGTDKYGNTCFIIASKNKTYNIKYISYLQNGKRNKEKFPFYQKATKGAKYGRCLYGLHLLSDDKIICLVESEKTAILGSFYYPQFDWLATGGANGLTSETIIPIIKRKIYYLCDADKAGRESSSIKKLNQFNVDFKVVDLFPDRQDGYDLADYILNDDLNNLPIIEPKEEPKKQQTTPKHDEPRTIWEVVENWINENYEIRNNQVANKIEYRPKNTEYEEEFTEINENDIFREMQINSINFSMNKLKAMLGSSFVQHYDIFLDYFEQLKPYNPTVEPDYINQIEKYIPLHESDKERFKTQFKKFLVRSVACSLGKAINKNAIIFANAIQSSGKSTFLRWLCPPALKEYIAENIQTDKDSLIAMCTNFIINMDEMATLSKSDINALKSVLSKDVFKGRLPYAARETRLIRRANLVGSTNNLEFLSDETGNVRWIVFEITGRTNFDYQTDIDINRVWAQAYYLYKQDFYFELTLEEMRENEEHNKQHMIRSIEQELIQAFFFPPNVGNFRETVDIEKDIHFKTATDIKTILANKAPHERTILNNIGKALKILGYERKSVRKNGFDYPIKGYYIVEKSM